MSAPSPRAVRSVPRNWQARAACGPNSSTCSKRLRGSALRRIVDAADLDGEPPAPEPDVVEPYRWFVARLGDGVKLTGAGYLPPALVVETMRALGWDADWFGAGNREDLTRPVAELRDTARRLGLVRVHRNELRPTAVGRRLADDPVGLWRHIAARLPLGRGEADRVAGLLWLLGVAAGRSASRGRRRRGHERARAG